MEEESQVSNSNSADTNGESAGANRAGAANGDIHRPAKVLPATRAAIDRQLDLLRAFVAASGRDKRLVQNGQVAQIAAVSISTVSTCNNFLADAGFLVAASGRGYVPADAVFEFARAWEWNKETAAHKLAVVVENAWFWEALKQRLSFRELTDDAAIEVLATESSAGPTYRPQLMMLVDLLAVVGLITRENGIVRRSQGKAGQEQPKESGNNNGPAATASPTAAPAPASGMSLNMSVTVPMEQVSKWEPERIGKFFEEWAKLLSAKGAIERMLNEQM